MKTTSSNIFINALQPHQEELIHLSELAGIHMSQHVFRVLVELLNMQVDPAAIYKLLKQIRKTKRVVTVTSEESSNVL